MIIIDLDKLLNAGFIFIFQNRDLMFTRRALCISRSLRNSHGPQHFEEPHGFLFNEVNKTGREWWEIPMFVFVGSMVAFGIAYNFKPDTSLESWAKIRAQERLVEGKFITGEKLKRIGE